MQGIVDALSNSNISTFDELTKAPPSRVRLDNPSTNELSCTVKPDNGSYNDAEETACEGPSVDGPSQLTGTPITIEAKLRGTRAVDQAYWAAAEKLDRQEEAYREHQKWWENLTWKERDAIRAKNGGMPPAAPRVDHAAYDEAAEAMIKADNSDSGED